MQAPCTPIIVSNRWLREITTVYNIIDPAMPVISHSRYPQVTWNIYCALHYARIQDNPLLSDIFYYRTDYRDYLYVDSTNK